MVAQATPNRLLTAREEAFAQAMASGKGPTEAYRLAYSKGGNPDLHRITAYKIARRPHVAARIEALRKPDNERLFLTRARKREILMEIANSRKNRPGDRMKAVDLDNQMTGEYTQVVKVEEELTFSVILNRLVGAAPLPTDEEKALLAKPVDAITAPQEPMSLGEPVPVALPADVVGPFDADFREIEAETAGAPTKRFLGVPPTQIRRDYADE